MPKLRFEVICPDCGEKRTMRSDVFRRSGWMKEERKYAYCRSCAGVRAHHGKTKG